MNKERYDELTSLAESWEVARVYLLTGRGGVYLSDILRELLEAVEPLVEVSSLHWRILDLVSAGTCQCGYIVGALGEPFEDVEKALKDLVCKGVMEAETDDLHRKWYKSTMDGRRLLLNRACRLRRG